MTREAAKSALLLFALCMVVSPATLPALADPLAISAVREDFPAEQYSGAVQLPDFKGRDRDFVSYRTRIRDGINDGPDFAGHMALVQFGCGTECIGAFVADVRSGRVYKFPLGGEDYRRLDLTSFISSRLITAHWLKGNRCVEQKLLWNGDDFLKSGVIDYGDENACLRDSGGTGGSLCSGKGPDRLELTWREDGNGLTIRSGDQSEFWENSGSVGTGMAGHVYTSAKTGVSEVFLTTEIPLGFNVGSETKRPIGLFRDRVFWNCKDHPDQQPGSQ